VLSVSDTETSLTSAAVPGLVHRYPGRALFLGKSFLPCRSPEALHTNHH
jgi:L-lysine 2,3-aminomutase